MRLSRSNEPASMHSQNTVFDSIHKKINLIKNYEALLFVRNNSIEVKPEQLPVTNDHLLIITGAKPTFINPDVALWEMTVFDTCVYTAHRESRTSSPFMCKILYTPIDESLHKSIDHTLKQQGSLTGALKNINYK